MTSSSSTSENTPSIHRSIIARSCSPSFPATSLARPGEHNDTSESLPSSTSGDCAVPGRKGTTDRSSRMSSTTQRTAAPIWSLSSSSASAGSGISNRLRTQLVKLVLRTRRTRTGPPIYILANFDTPSSPPAGIATCGTSIVELPGGNAPAKFRREGIQCSRIAALLGSVAMIVPETTKRAKVSVAGSVK
uniref:Uncharacterized protein n=1 Tax=Mycena chlorophos TaxID=658473 RepID=A0ABQ0LAD3_MYCCL|nr:predicted protein [Mycena chlorophos]